MQGRGSGPDRAGAALAAVACRCRGRDDLARRARDRIRGRADPRLDPSAHRGWPDTDHRRGHGLAPGRGARAGRACREGAPGAPRRRDGRVHRGLPRPCLGCRLRMGGDARGPKGRPARCDTRGNPADSCNRGLDRTPDAAAVPRVAARPRGLRSSCSGAEVGERSSVVIRGSRPGAQPLDGRGMGLRSWPSALVHDTSLRTGDRGPAAQRCIRGSGGEADRRGPQGRGRPRVRLEMGGFVGPSSWREGGRRFPQVAPRHCSSRTCLRLPLHGSGDGLGAGENRPAGFWGGARAAPPGPASEDRLALSGDTHSPARDLRNRGGLVGRRPPLGESPRRTRAKGADLGGAGLPRSPGARGAPATGRIPGRLRCGNPRGGRSCDRAGGARIRRSSTCRETASRVEVRVGLASE